MIRMDSSLSLRKKQILQQITFTLYRYKTRDKVPVQRTGFEIYAHIYEERTNFG